MLFKVRDYHGIPVILTKENWYKKILDPIFGHPEVKHHLSKIKKTIDRPDFVYQSVRDPRSKLFLTGFASGDFATHYLAVVVKYVKEQGKPVGYISTVMINRKLPKQSQLLWQKRQST